MRISEANRAANGAGPIRERFAMSKSNTSSSTSANHYLINPEADMTWLKDRLDIGKLGANGLAV